MFNLLRFFTICSLLACLLASLLLGFFYRRTVIDNLVELAQENNIALGYTLITAVRPQLLPLIQADKAQLANGNRAALNTLHNAVVAQLRNSQIVKVKVYNLTGLTIFSTEAAQIGEDKSDNPGVQNALEGKTLSELTHRDTFSAFDDTLENLDVLGTYLPVYEEGSPDKVFAIVEIYSNISPLIQRIDATQRRVFLALLTAFGTLYGILWLIVRYASHILQRQYTNVQAEEQQLVAQKNNLEQVIAERSAALQKSHLQLEHELRERQLAQEQLQQYSARLQILRELDQGILAARSPQEIAVVALHHLRRLVPCPRASVVLFDYAAQQGIILAVHSEQAGALIPGARVPFTSFPILQHFDPQTHSSHWPLQVQPTPATDQPLIAIGIHYIAHIPLVTQQQLIGTLNLGASTADTIQPEHLEIARDVANLLAISVQQARLHEQIEQQATELAARVAELQLTKIALEEERLSLARRVEQRTLDLQTANRELAKSARLKDEFLAAISHELRTPLTAILAHTELLQREVYGALGDKQQRSLAIVQTAGNHLLALINDLLDLARLQEGKLQLQLSQVNLVELCQITRDLVEPTATAKQITLVTTVDPQLQTLMVDRRRLIQILTNLLDNAIKFTPPEGEVGLDVIADPVARQTCFVIWDQGVGIAQPDYQRIFEPFVQLDAGLSRNYPGVGLGLALVQRLVQLHKGEIHVESEVGKGSRFTVLLPWPTDLLPDDTPAHIRAAATLPPADPFATNGAVPLVLVAEDSDLNREFLAELLIVSGYKPLLAHNGAEALELAQQRPNLILMDVQMPVLDGLEAIRRLRAQGDLTPIIALTGMAMRDDELRCIEAGASGYVSKPFQVDQLLTLITMHLSARAHEGQN